MQDLQKYYPKVYKYYKKAFKNINKDPGNLNAMLDYFVLRLRFLRDSIILLDRNVYSEAANEKLNTLFTAISEYRHYKKYLEAYMTATEQKERYLADLDLHWQNFVSIVLLNLRIWFN